LNYVTKKIRNNAFLKRQLNQLPFSFFKMKTLFLHLGCLVTITIATAQSSTVEWAKQIGGTDHDYGNSMAVDGSGNVYTTGGFNGTADFDPGTSTISLTPAGGPDAFITKLDGLGNLAWARNVGGTLEDIGRSIGVDGSGNVYTTGYFNGTADFDPGSSTFNVTANGVSDVFISKLDNAGNFVWAKTIGGTLEDSGRSIAVDASGNVYVLGWFGGTVDLDPGVGVFNLSSAGSSDIFILKLDDAGSFAWAKRFGGTSPDLGTAITIDGSGNVYTTGYFYGTADFDPGAPTFELTVVDDADVFVSKLDPSGNFIWVKSWGGDASSDYSNDFGLAITVDPSGNVYTTGQFNKAGDFDPGAGTFNLTPTGYQDMFVSKLNDSGNFVWAKSMGGINSLTAGLSISLDPTGNVYTMCLFSATVDFDPGAGTYELTSAGQTDMAISKLDPSGNFIWIETMGGALSDYGTSVNVDASGNVYASGSFSGTADFDPGSGVFNLVSAGLSDHVVLKLKAMALTTGLDDKPELQITVFPNPVVNQVSVEILGHFTDAAVLQLIDCTGHGIEQRRMTKEGTEAFDLRSVAPGLYFIKIELNARVVFRKMLKQ